MNSHKWDKAYHKAKKNKKEQKKSSNNTKSESEGTQENKEEDEGALFTQKKIICFCCGKEGHYANKCPDKDKIPQDQWAIKKGLTLLSQQTECKPVPETKEKEVNGWITVSLYNKGEIDLEDQVIIDTGATFSSFKD